MSLRSRLRGGCQCGRNRYIIEIPEHAKDAVQVLFNADLLHQRPLATPLAAFLRVPLSWYHSTTQSFFPDETHSMIRRVFEGQNPLQRQTKRYFCGFCGTPLSYWTERPPSEADFIQLTLASLCGEDLRDLEDMGLIPGSEDVGPSLVSEGRGGPVKPAQTTVSAVERTTRGVPWFDSLVEGSRLGNIRRSQEVEQSEGGGGVRVEWEVIEWTEGEDEAGRSVEEAPEAGAEDVEMGGTSGKRKRRGDGDSDATAEAAH
ncbi:hypothetical protein SODALDRAFT_333428 [Sodiomyces alkalinus F11]|uniref:CENP-V/GFA domain-containing protein n=1 Tax=Sodiomyces alkalinus (strain CBS 110278 / VKM F-3762 / F11) TaxID=1314773 RepID=A0A3N2PWD6_SODAK|nr:hypothetical protein SODALDRAFT_333428 [Sodiomyces alkalinus F11]ROT38804.1 hypothetical protein SODALDRAFT_333428 [Sodiomyces alkalinus F11]